PPHAARRGRGRPRPAHRRARLSRRPRSATMAMTDFVVREAIVPALTATTKEAVVREIVDNLRATVYLNAAVSDDIVRQIMKREQLGSTGIGRGIAIPHTKHSSVERLTGTVAVSKAGVTFDSIDGEPVYVF